MITQSLITYEREYKEMKLHLLDEVLNLLAGLNKTLSYS